MFIEIFIIILIIIYITASVAGGADKITMQIPLVAETKAEASDKLPYPLFCIDSEPLFSDVIPDFPHSKKEEVAGTIFKNNNLKFQFISRRLYTEVLIAINFLKHIPKQKVIIVIEPKFGIVSQICSAIYGVNVILFSIKPYYDMKIKGCKNINIINRMPAEEDFKKYKGLAFINLSSLSTKYFSYINLGKSIIAFYKNIEYLMNGFRPEYSVHLCKSMHNKLFNAVLLPVGRYFITPYSTCSITRNFGISCRGVEFQLVDLSDIWARLMLFDLCVRNLNHGYSQEEIWDTYMHKKIIGDNKLFIKYIGPIPSPLNNTRCLKGLKYTNPKYFITRFPDYETFKYSYITSIIDDIDTGPLYYFFRDDRQVNILYSEILAGVLEQYKENNLGFYIDKVVDKFAYMIKYYGTIFISGDIPRHTHNYYFTYIKVKNYAEACKRAKALGITLIPPTFDTPDIINRCEKYLRNIKFPAFERVWVMGEEYNTPIIIALNKIYPYATINVIGDISFIYTVNYKYTSPEFMKLAAAAGDVVIL